MAKKINPEFQAAPFLGASSHDPIDQLRRHGQGKLEDIKEERKKREAQIAMGLKDILIEVKGWEDQNGFEEIMGDRQKIIDTFLEYSRQGMNLTSPTTAEEITMSKGIGQALARVKQKVDVWNQQKEKYDFYTKQMDQVGAEEKIDIDASKANISKILNSTSVLERGTMLDSLLVMKPDVNSVNEYVLQNEKRIYKPPTKTEAVYDPESGLTTTKSETVDDPVEQEKIVQSYKDLYATSPKEVADGLQEVRKRNKTVDEARGFDVLTDDEYFAQMYDLNYRDKLMNKLTKSGGGLGLSISVFGRKANVTPGEQRDEPLPYGDKTFTNAYKFFSKDVFTINVGRNGTKMFTGDSWEEITDGGDVEANLLYYDAKDDVFIFRTSQTGNEPYVMNNATISVPRSVFGKEADNLPIKTTDGTVKSLIEVFGPLKKIKKDPFGNTGTTWEKKPYIPKK